MYDFGAILRQLREKQGLTQAQLAERINRSKTVICKYESNTLSPTFETVRELASIFNVSLDFLAGLEKSESIPLNNLTPSQAQILKDTVRLFEKKPEQGSLPLTNNQNELLGRTLAEFIRQNKGNA